MTVRRPTPALGYRFRLHRRDLPGKPDLVFVSKRKVIFVHGRVSGTPTGTPQEKALELRGKYQGLTALGGESGIHP
ncbi:PDDEXK family nuclease [Burkholderia thailandensis]|uniref:hypothetical protein n=1 Tax=Burkholderia thailandensis TaxID=57975 RepID=UPI00190F31D9|nr:hypothetical protein [Burkholderia thailandensis]